MSWDRLQYSINVWLVYTVCVIAVQRINGFSMYHVIHHSPFFTTFSISRYVSERVVGVKRHSHG